MLCFLSIKGFIIVDCFQSHILKTFPSRVLKRSILDCAVGRFKKLSKDRSSPSLYFKKNCSVRERFSERVKPYYLNVLTVDHASRGRDSGLESQDYLSYIGRMLRGPWKKNEVKIFTSRMHRARHLEILNLIWLEFVHVQVKCSCL